MLISHPGDFNLLRGVDYQSNYCLQFIDEQIQDSMRLSALPQGMELDLGFGFAVLACRSLPYTGLSIVLLLGLEHLINVMCDSSGFPLVLVESLFACV